MKPSDRTTAASVAWRGVVAATRPLGIGAFIAGATMLVSERDWLEAVHHRDSFKPTHVAMSDIKRLPDDTWMATFTPTPPGASSPAVGPAKTVAHQTHIDHILGGKEDAKIPWYGTHTGTILLSDQSINMPVMPLEWQPDTIRRIGMRAILPGVALSGLGLVLAMMGGAMGKPRPRP